MDQVTHQVGGLSFFLFRRLFEIRVRTRELGRALGHVTGRGVGRGDRDDSDDAPQRQRPTASARRQRAPVTAATEADGASIETDVFLDDPMASADVEDTGADIHADIGAQAAENEHEGFSGGPSDPSVLTQYADHVACSVWTGEERPELKLSSHGRKVQSLGRSVPAIEGLVTGIGLSPLIACLVDIGDQGLLSLFVERWHQETSSFHLPVGEVTITLDDISSLLHLPVVGDLHAFQPLHVDDAIQMLVDLLMVSTEDVRAETGQCRGPYIRLQWVRDMYQRRCQAGHWTAAARAYLLHLLGCTLFANKSATHVHVVFLEALRDLSQTGRYAWGVAALCWIFEHFPSVAESTVDPDYYEDSPRACRWIATKKNVKNIRTLVYRECLDRLQISDVCWIPYGEHRSVMRQFGYTQTIPALPVGSWVSYDDIHDRWMHYSEHMVAAGEVCAMPGQCASDYMDWFFRILHPFMTPGQTSDPLPDRHGPQPPVVPPEPRAPSTSTMDEPRHAVEICSDIAERLERHLSLGVVTPGSSSHDVIQECIKMARSVTQDQLVYVRS
ncbi:Protein MAIN-LIKE 1 [Glycine soja]